MRIHETFSLSLHNQIDYYYPMHDSARRLENACQVVFSREIQGLRGVNELAINLAAVTNNE